MRSAPHIMSVWQQGGALVGDEKAPHTRVTVEPAWWLNTAYDVFTRDPSRLPYRWFVRADGERVEVEVPNVVHYTDDFSIDADAATCTITIRNTATRPNMHPTAARRMGDPGRFSPSRGGMEAEARWGPRDRSWEGILAEGALVRTWQGFGGRHKGIAQAVADGNLLLKGTWIVDSVQTNSSGDLELSCRDMAALLLIDQTLYPPLVPDAWYPPSFERWHDEVLTFPAVPQYDSTDPTHFGPGAEGGKWIPDGAVHPSGLGYYLVGTDGGVFAFGRAPFYGSRGDATDNAPMRSIAVSPSGRGYWIAGEDGGVHAFGDVGFYGSLAGSPLANVIVKIRCTPTGRGYWMMDLDGAMFAFGDAAYHGGTPPTSQWCVDFQPTPTGLGYWILAMDGAIYAFGDAVYYGGANTLPLPVGDTAQGLTVTPSGLGYYIATERGEVHAYGDAHAGGFAGDGRWPEAKTQLADPIRGIQRTPSGLGYILIGGDGGVFSFGDAGFYGSLPAAYTMTVRTDGNYTDITDVAKQVALWSGFLLYQEGGADDVYGNLEMTGTYSDTKLGVDLFQGKSPMDVLNALKAQVGFICWVDGEGAFRWSSPNWWQPGNELEDGSRTQQIPEVDERVNLFSHSQTRSLQPVRSEIVVSSAEPTIDMSGTVTTRYTPPNASALRGMVRPGLMVDAMLTDREDQQVMAELIALHLWFKQHTSTTECINNPAVQINDQVWVWEEVSGETTLRYVRGVSSTHDVETGEFTMRLTTNRLGFWPNWWTEA